MALNLIWMGGEKETSWKMPNLTKYPWHDTRMERRLSRTCGLGSTRMKRWAILWFYSKISSNWIQYCLINLPSGESIGWLETKRGMVWDHQGQERFLNSFFIRTKGGKWRRRKKGWFDRSKQVKPQQQSFCLPLCLFTRIHIQQDDHQCVYQSPSFQVTE